LVYYGVVSSTKEDVEKDGAYTQVSIRPAVAKGAKENGKRLDTAPNPAI
jgi:hypothetical protein